MDDEQIRYKDEAREFAVALRELLANRGISDHNKEVVQRFLRDAALGKTTVGTRRRVIGPARRKSYIAHLMPLCLYLQKDIDQVVLAHIEGFVEALQADQIRSRQRRLISKG